MNIKDNLDIKSIIIDIDGTLLNSEKKILSSTKEILMKAQYSGVKIILASGRPTKGIIRYAKKLDLDKFNGLIISYNGAKVVDALNNKTYLNRTLNKKVSNQILKNLEKYNLIPFIDNDDYLFVNNVYKSDIDIFGKKINIIKSEKNDNDLKLCELDHLYEYKEYLNKILVAGNPEYLRNNLHNIINPYKAEINIEFSEDYLLEISSKNVNKATGIEVALNILNINRENTIAFGDGENDISMLNYAGIGVAMENANSKVKKYADIITHSNDNDGIFRVLKKLDFVDNKIIYKI